MRAGPLQSFAMLVQVLDCQAILVQCTRKVGPLASLTRANATSGMALELTVVKTGHTARC